MLHVLLPGPVEPWCSVEGKESRLVVHAIAVTSRGQELDEKFRARL